MKKKNRKDKIGYKNKIRKQKLDRIKFESKTIEDDCGITDESMARMKHQMVEQYGLVSEVIRDSRLEKMSDILLEYGEPLLDTIDFDDKTEYDRAIQMLIVLWNHATIQEVSKDWNETGKILKPIMPDAESVFCVSFHLAVIQNCITCLVKFNNLYSGSEL